MSIIGNLLNLLAPYECLGCGIEGEILCRDCSGRLTRAPERCYRCLSLSAGFATCTACGPPSGMDRVQAAASYEGIARELVLKLKFAGARDAAKTMARHLAPYLKGVDKKAIIVPVPTAASRARGRGFDQAVLLARELSRQTGLRYVNCLARRGRTRQVGTSRQQRFQQLQGVFRVKTAPQRTDIILLDDVLTTGATLESAAKSLRAAGAGSITGLVFAQA